MITLNVKKTLILLFKKTKILSLVISIFSLSKSYRLIKYKQFLLTISKHSNGKSNFFLDATVLTRHDAGGGIQRVQKQLILAALKSQNSNLNIHPCYFDGSRFRFYPKNLDINDIPNCINENNKVVEFADNDIYLSLDLDYKFVTCNQKLYNLFSENGIKVFFMIYDLLPLEYPEFFPTGISEWHSKWLKIVIEYDGLICISETVKTKMLTWLDMNYEDHKIKSSIHSVKLGSNPSDNAEKIARAERSIIHKFIMVGTLEPRKGHLHVLKTFDEIWRSGIKCQLIIIGKKGWGVDSLEQDITNHYQFNKNLIWINNASDEELFINLNQSSALIAASIDEGFGLPLVESARFGLPIIARDIPIFREIMGDLPKYFSDTPELDLKSVVLEFISGSNLRKDKSYNLSFQTWDNCLTEIVTLMANNG
jgi:glycosyltransferase involved in cell wall biosynthesis